MMPVKLALSLVCLDSAIVWLSCQAIIGISVLAGLFQVFAWTTTHYTSAIIHILITNDYQIKKSELLYLCLLVTRTHTTILSLTRALS